MELSESAPGADGPAVASRIYKGMGINPSISQRTNEFAVLLKAGADVDAVQDALQVEGVYYHSYVHHNLSGRDQIVLLLNASQERLFLASKTVEMDRWLLGGAQGEAPRLDQLCSPDFQFARHAQRLEAMYWVLNQDVKIPNCDGDHANLVSSEHVERLVCLHDNEFNHSFVFGHSRRGCCGPQSRLGLCLACLQGSGGGFRGRREERERLQSRRSSAARRTSRLCCAGLYKIVVRGGGMTDMQVDTIRDHFGDETGWYVSM